MIPTNTGQVPSEQEMLDGYRRGLFLMGDAGSTDRLHWYRPNERGVLPLDERFHVARKLRRKVICGAYTITSDRAFGDVVNMCAETREDRPETWINLPMKRLYQSLHAKQYAHSIEVWDDASLVGGLFGIHLGGASFGETMFSRLADASKIALVHLVISLRRQGFVLLDTQYMTPHLAQFGGVAMTASHYEMRLCAALKRDAQWCSDVGLDAIRPALTP